MKSRISSFVVVLAFGALVTSAWACPKSAKCSGKKAAAQAKGDALANSGQPCTGRCAHPCDPAKCAHRCDPAKCCKTHATTVAFKEAGEGASAIPADKDDAKSGAVKTKLCPLTGKPIPQEDCPLSKKVDAVLAALPAMMYRIGEETTCCSKTAKRLAEKAGKPMQYVVGDTVFDKDDEAIVKLAALLEGRLDSLKSIQFSVGGKCYSCPMTAKKMAKSGKTTVAYRVGGVDFADKDKAEEALKLVNDKLASVKMTYKVGDKSFCCDKMAGAAVKKTGKKMIYVVGERETPCDKAAKLMLVEAKIRTIVETAAAIAVAAVVAVSTS